MTDSIKSNQYFDKVLIIFMILFEIVKQYSVVKNCLSNANLDSWSLKEDLEKMTDGNVGKKKDPK